MDAPDPEQHRDVRKAPRPELEAAAPWGQLLIPTRLSGLSISGPLRTLQPTRALFVVRKLSRFRRRQGPSPRLSHRAGAVTRIVAKVLTVSSIWGACVRGFVDPSSLGISQEQLYQLILYPIVMVTRGPRVHVPVGPTSSRGWPTVLGEEADRQFQTPRWVLKTQRSRGAWEQRGRPLREMRQEWFARKVAEGKGTGS